MFPQSRREQAFASVRHYPMIDRYFDNHLPWPSLVGGAEYHKWKSRVISGGSLAIGDPGRLDGA